MSEHENRRFRRRPSTHHDQWPAELPGRRDITIDS